MKPAGRTVAFRQKNRKALLFAHEWLQILVIALTTVTLLLTFAVRVVGVYGDSMLPTLHQGDRLLLSSFGETYKRGDIVVIDRYTDEPLIKRVIAVAGDVVSITEDGCLYINGELQTERYVRGFNRQGIVTKPLTVPEGCVFVLGDNRAVSRDSRSKDVGMVSVKDIVGKAVYRVWPLGDGGDIYKTLN